MQGSKLPTIQKLATMIWARNAMLASGMPKVQWMNSYFANPCDSSAGNWPSVFDGYLGGRATPKLIGTEDSPGGPLRIEQEFPGTLKWLIHPLWQVLATPDRFGVWQLRRLMCSTEVEVTETVMSETAEGWIRRDRALDQVMNDLVKIGSLDALAALTYAVREAVLLGHQDDYERIEEQFATEVENWKALGWLDLALRRMLIKQLQDFFVVDFDSAPIDRFEAIFFTESMTFDVPGLSPKAIEVLEDSNVIHSSDPVIVQPESRPGKQFVERKQPPLML